MALLRLILVTCHFIGFLASPHSFFAPYLITITTTTASPLAQEYENYDLYDFSDEPTGPDTAANVNLDNLAQLFEDYGEQVDDLYDLENFAQLYEDYGEQEYEDYEYDEPKKDRTSAKVNLENLAQLIEDYGEQIGGFDIDFLTKEDLGVCLLPPEFKENRNGK